MEENKIILKLIKQKAKEKDTYSLPGVTKTTWKYKKPGELHRSTIYRRKLKISKKKGGNRKILSKTLWLKYKK